MKKALVRRFLFLVLALLTLFLSACSGGQLALETGADESVAGAEEAKGGKEALSVGVPFDRETLSSLPVATADMSSDELREICLNFAKMQGSIPWVSDKDIRYNLEDTDSKEMNFKARTVYAGLPYTRAGSNLYTFMDFVDEETGVLDPEVADSVGGLLGDNCCTSLFWAWARVSSSITFKATQGLVPKTGIVPIGPYTFDQSIDSYKRPNTKDICDANGEQTMYESYAALKIADGIVVNTLSSAARAHHVVMCSVLPVVARNADGTINGEESYLRVVDQSSGLHHATLENGRTAYSNAGIDKEVSFSGLFSQGYLPFSIPELLDPATVQKAAVSSPLENGGTVTLSDLGSVVLSANYAFSKLIITVTDKEGVARDFSSYARGVANYTMELQSRCVTMSRQLKKGSFQIEISALLGSGETLPVFSGTLVKE